MLCKELKTRIMPLYDFALPIIAMAYKSAPMQHSKPSSVSVTMQEKYNNYSEAWRKKNYHLSIATQPVMGSFL